ncbi:MULTISPECIES: HemK2/MTQ2 family protein methyltransferase [Metallosphaera]|uniref:Methyltransferase n=3 Tax=Metallosphaera TaxID=41980 RepID=A0A088E192_9CREN|nr:MULTISPECIES: HemK2/MTQ2 family protein methyltransferase [Metallosphaera]ABP94242.1 putative methylase [Metallosphaera sedula DSM 5348]AIM26229.1 putative methylase [Metallosphaera sedula]AKV73249.1 methyltransferase [Metallosphaera sedula]AKV75493.1 methyltransferase [Metallosphaera sedula]AKV77739.1 methyltransferase [Metallosphaera sedula]
MDGYRVIGFGGYKLCVNEEVYEPAEDSEILASILDVKPGEKVIDVGSGSGILGIVAGRMGASVISIDVNPYATEATLCSSKLNHVNIEVINCDSVTCLRGFRVDALIFNPPYLPVEETSSWIGYSWSGGKGGTEVLIRVMSEVNARSYYFVYSSFTDEEEIDRFLKSRGLEINKVKERVIGFEVLKAVKVVAKGYTGGA